MKPESPEKYDYEYVRNGTANIFVALEFKAGKLVTQVTERRTMNIECTGRRIGDLETLTQEVAAWTKRRNEHEKKIDWKFTREKADKKLSKSYL
nr:hypothetical protein BSM_32160 [uncultured archaeon]